MSTMFLTLNQYFNGRLPSFLSRLTNAAAFDHIWVEPLETTLKPDEAKLVSNVLFEQELALPLPSGNAVSLLLAPGGGGTIVSLEVDILPSLLIRLINVPVSLRFSPDVFRPVRRMEDGGGTVRYVPDPSRPYAQADSRPITVTLDKNGAIAFDGELRTRITEPVMLANTDIVIESADIVFDRTGDSSCLVLQWMQSNLNPLLGHLAPNLTDRSQPVDTLITLRIILGSPLREVRFEWDAGGVARSYELPGLKTTVPGQGRFSVLLTAQGQDALNRFAFVLTLPAGVPLTASTNFAWEREGDRELQNDEKPPSNTSLFQATLTPNQATSVVLMDLPIGSLGLPVFLQQLGELVSPLNPDDPNTICTPVVLNSIALTGDRWNGILAVNLQDLSNAFTLPFLKQGTGDSAQFIQIYSVSDLTNLPIDLVKATVPNKDIGFIKVGMLARIKVDAYPFQQFGSISAQVQQITPDSSNEDNFTVTLGLLQNSIKTNEHSIQLFSGLTVQAEVQTRNQRLFDVLLSK